MKLAALRVGSGASPVVLLHGFLGSGRNLMTLARQWSQADPTRTFLLLDLTGHGQSPPLPPGADLETLARDVLETAALESLPQPLSLVGHSLGGRVAMQAKLLAPEAIQHVTLLDISPGPIGEAGDEQSRTIQALAGVPATFPDRDTARRALLGGGVPPALVEWVLTNLIPADSGYRWRFDRQALLDLRPRINAADLWPAVERFGGSMRCIRGDRSPYVPDRDAERLTRLGCPVDTLQGAGHFVHVDQPRALLALLLAGTPAC